MVRLSILPPSLSPSCHSSKGVPVSQSGNQTRAEGGQKGLIQRPTDPLSGPEIRNITCLGSQNVDSVSSSLNSKLPPPHFQALVWFPVLAVKSQGMGVLLTTYPYIIFIHVPYSYLHYGQLANSYSFVFSLVFIKSCPPHQTLHGFICTK